VGKHPGIVPAKQWIKVQESLERNKSKAYRKPRNNEALLTGLLYCACGERMYPKLTRRKTPEGAPVYTYVCKMKERSKKARCSRRNVSGNILDAAVLEQIKGLTGHEQTFLAQLEKSKQFYTGNREQYDKQLTDLRIEYGENEKKMEGLVDSLPIVGESSAKLQIAKRIEKLSEMNREIEIRIRELEGLTEANHLSDMEFDMLRQMLVNFRQTIDGMSVEEKRSAIRTVVRKVVWDGTNAHLVLFGADEGDIEFPDMSDRITGMEKEAPEDEPLEEFYDVDYEEAEKTPWGEDSK